MGAGLEPRSRRPNPCSRLSRFGKRITQKEVVATSLEIDKRSPDGMVGGEQFPVDEPGSFKPAVPTGYLRRQRQEQLVEEPLGEEVTDQPRPRLDQHQIALPGAANRVQHHLCGKWSLFSGDLNPSRRRQD